MMSLALDLGCCEAIPNDLVLSSIDPRKDAKFSPNLYRFLKKQSSYWVQHCRVYRDGDGLLRIGVPDGEGGLSCANLMGVLFYGAREQVWPHNIENIGGIVELKDFWKDYQRIGRCAIDLDHKKIFIGNATRWKTSEDGKNRSCLWCGNAKQYFNFSKNMS